MKKLAAVSALTILASAALARAGAFRALFSMNYLPHLYCYRAQPGLVWTNVLADVCIAASYAVIFALLFWIAARLRRQPQLRPFVWLFVAFASFILLCGLTHLMEAVTVWFPFYPLSAALKVGCAAVSVPTAILFFKASPTVVAECVRFFRVLATAQHAREDLEANYRGQIEAIARSQMMVEFSMEGIILRANDKFLAAFGYRQEEIVGKHHSVLVSGPECAGPGYTDFWVALRQGAYQAGVFERVDKAGSPLWIEATYNPVLAGNGTPERVVHFASNITEQILAQMRLREAEAHLQAILNSVADGIVSIDAAGLIVSFNPAASNMFEYRPDQVVGKNIKMLMPQPDRDAHDGYLARTQSTGQPTVIGKGRELQGLSSTGRVFPIELTVTGMTLEGRQFWVGLVRDITEQTRQRNALRKTQAFLEQTGKIAGVGGWEVDLVTHQVSWTEEIFSILGADPSYRPTLEDSLRLTSQESRPTIDAAIERAAASAQGWDLELAMTTFDGRSIWVRSVAQVELAAGQPRRLVGALQDITARVEERMALKDAKMRAHMAAESCGIGIWDLDCASGAVHYDPLMYKLYGRDPERGTEGDVDFWMNHVHPDDRPWLRQAFQDALAGKMPYPPAGDTPYAPEFRVVWPDGSVHHLRASAIVTRDEQGRPLRMVGTNLDITAAKAAAEELRLSGENHQMLITGVKDYAIFMLSPEGLVSTWNEGAERIKGYRAEEIIGSHFSRFYSPQDIAGGVPQWELQVAAEVGRFEAEGWRLRKDGSRFWASVLLTALYDANGKLRGFGKATRDITDRKIAEEELRDRANLLNLSRDAILVRELDGTIRFWNDGAQRMYGYSKDRAEGQISHYLLGTAFPRSMEEIDADLHRDGYWEGELQHTTQDGSRIFVESRWALQKVANGSVVRVLEINTDITARVMADRELARNIQALERSNRELDAFAYAASHDLKAPLRVIHNASIWIEEDLAQHLTAETSENMNLLRARVRRMDRLLDDLLQYSRIGRESQSERAEPISGLEMIENILELLAPPPGFIVDASSSLVGIQVLRMPLQQILINLISNAIKHHDKPSGIIHVDVEDLGDIFRFSVQDDGPGIAPEYHQKIFRMFQTLKPRDQVEGSGMGLAMVRKHIDVAGGELHLDSAVGRGSTFSFTWPKRQAHQPHEFQTFTSIGANA